MPWKEPRALAVSDATRVALGSNRKPWKESRFSRPELHSPASYRRKQVGLPVNPGPQLHSPESFHRRLATLGDWDPSGAGMWPEDQMRGEMPLSPGDVAGAASLVAKAVKVLPAVQKKMLAKFAGKVGSKSPAMVKVRKGNSPDHDTEYGFILSNGKPVPHIGEHYKMVESLATPKEIAEQNIKFSQTRRTLTDDFMDTGAIRVDENPRQGSIWFELFTTPTRSQIQQIAKISRGYGSIGIDYKGDYKSFDRVGQMMREMKWGE